MTDDADQLRPFEAFDGATNFSACDASATEDAPRQGLQFSTPLTRRRASADFRRGIGSEIFCIFFEFLELPKAEVLKGQMTYRPRCDRAPVVGPSPSD
jgi:hypothetical protein